MSRVPIYLITFFTYAALHMMVMTYSFNKHYYQVVFGVSNLFLGILDSIIYLSVAIGTFARYSIVNNLHPVQGTFYTAFPMAFGLAIIPIAAFIYQNDSSIGHATPFIYFIFVIAALLFGFFQLNFFPAMLTIFGNSFNIKNDGRIAGIWSSKSNAGNILGFLISNLLVYQFKVKWEYTIIICSSFLIIMAILLRCFIKNPDFKQQPRITSRQLFEFFRKIWSHTEFKLYILSFSFFKAVIYSYELWTPKFLVQAGFGNYSGYVPMVFDASTLVGSFFMGLIYKSQSNTDSQKDASSSKAKLILTKYKFFAPSIVVVIVSFCYIAAPSQLAVYFVFGSLMGMFLGSVYNSLENSQVLNYTKNDSAKTDMFSTMNAGIGSALVGITQFIIGFSLDIGSQNGSASNLVKKGLIYVVIGCIAIIASIVTLIRTCYDKAETQMTDSEKSERYSIRNQMIELKDRPINETIYQASQIKSVDVKI